MDLPPLKIINLEDGQHNQRWRYWVDLITGASLGLFFAFSAGVCFKTVFADLGQINDLGSDAHKAAKILSVFSIGLYTLLIGLLFVMRVRPKVRAAGLWPNIAAILGGFMMSALLWLKPQDLPLWAQIVSSFLVITGNIFCILVISRLGRSFSILPEARKLVTTGPYAYIRHPLYLAEAIATIGAVISFLSYQAVMLMIAQFGLQIIRMRYEERILRDAFPDYAEYAKRTARLIPGVY